MFSEIGLITEVEVVYLVLQLVQIVQWVVKTTKKNN